MSTVADAAGRLGVLRGDPLRREGTDKLTGVTLYTDNNDFFDGQAREQEPLLAQQLHVLYGFGRGMWAGLDGTFYAGGRTTVNGTINDDRQSNSRLGLTVGIPVTRHQSLKLHASTGATARIGGKFTTLTLLWQYRWGGEAPASTERP